MTWFDTHAMLPLGGVFRHPGHIGDDKGSCIIADITGVDLRSIVPI